MLRTGPLYTMEERRGGFVLVWRENDWALPRRMVASFPPHPHDRNEAVILAEMLVEHLNQRFPNRATDAEYDPELDVPPAVIQCKLAAAEIEQPGEHAVPDHTEPAPAKPAVSQPMTPLRANAATRMTPRERKAMPEGWEKLTGRDKVAAMRNTLFSGNADASQEVQ